MTAKKGKKRGGRRTVPQEVKDNLFEMYKSGASCAVMADRSGLAKSTIDRYRGEFKQLLKAEGKAPSKGKAVRVKGSGKGEIKTVVTTLIPNLEENVRTFKAIVHNQGVRKGEDYALLRGLVDQFFPPQETA